MKLKSHWHKGLEGIAFKSNYSRFSIFSSDGYFVQWSRTVLAILLQSHISNIPIKFE